MRPHIRPTLLAAAAAAAGLLACSRGAPEPKTPLGAPPPAAAASQGAEPLTTGARSALDRGNQEFRAGHYDAALAHYRAAAQAAPKSAAPYFGVYMAAKKLGNAALADSAQQEITRRSDVASPMLSDSSMKAMHSVGAPKS